ncbi:ShlB/FhaC/HecB family hemolysin secretion/activation protein [Arcobacter arenosus]|uniref:ShlB/FhaC/HecB family hemolysin secretion/activation protein n=1 Tax=Arcobacter arenosus TaxID=2576037 RepID=UPI003BA91021
MKKTSIVLATTLSLYSAPLPNIGDVLKEVKPPQIEKKKEVLPTLQQESDEYKKSFKDGRKVFIKSYLINGNTQLSTKKLQIILKPYEEKELSFKEIQEIVALITKVYRDEGYFIARAYIPTQNLQAQDGVLKIAIIEGAYGEFKLENSSLIKDSILQDKLDVTKTKEVIAIKDLQRTLLLINDTPGVKVSSTKIAAGKEVGTSDFIIGTQTTQPYNGYVIADNYGSKFTGKHRVMAGVDINSPFKIGDKISLSALSSEDMGLLNGRVGYEFPIYKNGLKGEISYSKTTYELGDKYKNLDALGHADSFVALFTYPIIRSNSETLNTYLRTSYNKMNDKIQAISSDIEKNTLVAKIGLDYLKNHLIYDKYSQTKIDVSLSLGRLKFKYAVDKADDEAGANTNGSFSKINIELENNTLINDKINWKNKIQLQYALGNKNLDGSEDLSLGGINGVKFYPSGEESAENGYIYTTELTYTLPSFNNLNSKIGMFYDVGRVSMSRDITNEKNRTLQDAGISYSGYYKDFFVNSYLAYKIGGAEVTSRDDYDSRFMFQAGWVF